MMWPHTSHFQVHVTWKDNLALPTLHLQLPPLVLHDISNVQTTHTFRLQRLWLLRYAPLEIFLTTKQQPALQCQATLVTSVGSSKDKNYLSSVHKRRMEVILIHPVLQVSHPQRLHFLMVLRLHSWLLHHHPLLSLWLSLRGTHPCWRLHHISSLRSASESGYETFPQTRSVNTGLGAFLVQETLTSWNEAKTTSTVRSSSYGLSKILLPRPTDFTKRHRSFCTPSKDVCQLCNSVLSRLPIGQIHGDTTVCNQCTSCLIPGFMQGIRMCGHFKLKNDGQPTIST